jgi:peptidyl-prolyl cis-trans isomerase C
LGQAAEVAALSGAGMGVVEFKRPSDEAPVSGGRFGALRRRVVGLLREPLLHFLVVGLLIFWSAQAWRTAHDVRRIVVTPERVADLSTKYRMQFGAPPSRTQLNGLIDGYVEEEVLYREGVAQHLDRDDEIVRRRIAQKAQFLQQDAPPADPTEADLKAFYAAHLADYATPPRFSFSHLYFSTEAGEAAAQARATQALTRLNAGARPEQIAADSFPDLNAYAASSAAEVARIFGNSPLVAALPKAPVGRWAGPFRSGYGWHLVRVTEALPAKVTPYEAVKERLRADWFDDAHAKASAHALAAARARYKVVRADLPDARP